MRTYKMIARALALILIVASASFPVTAQQPTVTPPNAQKSVAPKAPGAAFETLLSYDAYKVYGEVRDVGQMLSTSDDFLDPVMRSEEHTSELQSHSDLVCR